MMLGDIVVECDGEEYNLEAITGHEEEAFAICMAIEGLTEILELEPDCPHPDFPERGFHEFLKDMIRVGIRELAQHTTLVSVTAKEENHGH